MIDAEVLLLKILTAPGYVGISPNSLRLDLWVDLTEDESAHLKHLCRQLRTDWQEDDDDE